VFGLSRPATRQTHELTHTPNPDFDDSVGEIADPVSLLADNDHPPEYYIRQWQEGNDEDGSKGELQSWHKSSYPTGLRSSDSSKLAVTHVDVT
jgi:hypothetical protein